MRMSQERASTVMEIKFAGSQSEPRHLALVRLNAECLIQPSHAGVHLRLSSSPRRLMQGQGDGQRHATHGPGRDPFATRVRSSSHPRSASAPV